MTAASPSSSVRSRSIRRAGVAAAVVLGAVLGGGALLHTSIGRPLLARLASGRCPFGRGSISPAQRDQARHLGLSRLVHVNADAPARPALGFQLGAMHQNDVVAWANVHGVTCKSESQRAGLACPAVDARVLGDSGAPAGSLYFRFDAHDRLVGILSMVRTPDVATAAAFGAATRTKLRAEMGEPTRATGTTSVASLTNGPLAQARAEYRYRDFAATTSVTNLGAPGYLVTREAELVD